MSALASIGSEIEHLLLVREGEAAEGEARDAENDQDDADDHRRASYDPPALDQRISAMTIATTSRT